MIKPLKSRSGAAPTLADVADAAQVSTATVSRSLNAPDQVGEDTRRRVMAAVERLGYAPNFGARALAAKRTNTVGAVIPTMENAIFAQGIQAFQETLHTQGFTLLAASSSYRPELEAEQIRTLVARGADALLLIGHDRDPVIYDFLQARETPSLIAWAYDPSAVRVSIGFDNRAAMRRMAGAVIAAGHRRIAMISGATAGNDRARERLEGARQAMAEAGLNAETPHLVETIYGVDAGAEAFATLMARRPRPTAVICGNDVLAAGAMSKARELGLSAPADISITGFDDLELARVVTPALTTVAVPHKRMGAEAARMLIRMIGGWIPDRSVRLETSIRLRGTLGPPPGGA